MSEGQLYITNEYSFRVLYFISIFLKRKVQYRVKYEMLTLSFFIILLIVIFCIELPEPSG